MAVQTEGAAIRSRLRRVASSLWFRALVTLALLGLVGSDLDWHGMADRVRHGDFAYFVAAVALVVLALIVGACRWHRLLAASDIDVSPKSLARVYAVATFSGTFLPTTAGADFVRTLMISRRGATLGRTTLTVIVDRGVAMLGLLALAWLGVVLEPSRVPRGAIVFLAWITAVFVGASTLAVVAMLFDSPRAQRLLPVRLATTLRSTSGLLRSYLRRPDLLAILLVASIAYQAFIALQVMFLARAIGVHIGLPTATLAVTLVTVTTLLPVSIGGFGVREGTYVAVLGLAAVSATDATLISLLTAVTLFTASLPGAYLMARHGFKPAVALEVATWTSSRS